MAWIGRSGAERTRGWMGRALALEACLLASCSMMGCVDLAPNDADGFGGQNDSISTGGRTGAGGASSTGGRDGGSGGRQGRPGSGGDETGSGGAGSGGDAASGGRVGAGGGEAADGGASGGETSSGGEGGFGGAPAPGECVYDELADACLVPIPCHEGSSPFGGGTGTELSPYLVCSAAQLKAIGAIASSGRHFVLARSLDLSDVVDFETIGPGPLEPFYGRFDGAGRALVGLDIDGPGLFGEIAMGATVENLKLLDFEVTGTSSAGILAGGNAGSVINVETSGYVQGVEGVGGVVGGHYEMFDGAGSTLQGCSSSAQVDGSTSVGGVVGSSSVSMSTLHASGSVWASGDHVGGVVGRLRGAALSSSQATGDVEGRAAVGGLVGSMDIRTYGLLGTMVAYAGATDSTAAGNVTATHSAGGLVGQVARGGFVTECGAAGLVSVSGGPSDSAVAGGLVGIGPAVVTRSFASGAVSSSGTAGGLVGVLTGKWVVVDLALCPGETCVPVAQGFGKIETSYALGNVSGGLNVGGLIGITEHGEEPTEVGSVSFTYAMGVVTGGDPKGGLIGAEPAPLSVTSSYYSDQSPATGPGAPLSAAAFADSSSFVGWTFGGGTWEMSETLGRPVLAWE